MSGFSYEALIASGDRTGLLEVTRDLNVALLRKTMEHIEAHPEEHDQATWVCGSQMCFAGHAAVADGATLEPGMYMPNAMSEWLGTTHVSDYAQRALGLTSGEANRLFYADNSVEDLRVLVDDLIEKGHLADHDVRYYDAGITEFYAPVERAL
jgi:hypothetical protein